MPLVAIDSINTENGGALAGAGADIWAAVHSLLLVAILKTIQKRILKTTLKIVRFS